MAPRRFRDEDIAIQPIAVISSITMCLVMLGPVAVATGQSPVSTPAPSVAASPVDRRFVLPEGGYAVTFPEGWEVEVMPSVGEDVPVVRAEAPAAEAASVWGGFCEVKISSPCDGSCSSMIDEAAAREVAWFESGTDVPVPSTVESTRLVLPHLDAVRVRTETTLPASDRSMYFLTDGRVVATLLCMADDGPDDHWLSVVATFSFLP